MSLISFVVEPSILTAAQGNVPTGFGGNSQSQEVFEQLLFLRQPIAPTLFALALSSPPPPPHQHHLAVSCSTATT